MSDIATAIVSRLAAVPAVTGIIADRVYPDYVRQADKVYPLAVYSIKINPVATFDGNPGIRYATLSLAAVDTTYEGASALAAAIETAIEGQSGTWDTIFVQGVFLQDNGISDDVVTEPTTEEILAYVKSMTFDIASTY